MSQETITGSEVFDPKSFPAWLSKLDKSGKPIPLNLIALDPGETTGYALFEQGILVEQEQLPTHTIFSGIDILRHKFETEKPDIVIYEDFRIYDWKAASLSWNTLHTPRLIGGIQTLCHLNNIPMFTQMAQQPKMFCTDQKLEQWGYYKKGQRHARDAVRHGCYYLLFNNGKTHSADNLNL